MNTGEDLSGTGTEQIMSGFTGLLKGNKRSHPGVRLIDELMVDIMGGLIPGVLFTVSLIICFIFPLFLFEHFKPFDFTKATILKDYHIIIGGSSSFGGWFWFAVFLTFLIISYIAGHIFYRSDINKVDKEDINRRKRQNADDFKDEINRKNLQNKLIAEIIQELLIPELNSLITDNAVLAKLNKEDESDTRNLCILIEFINKKINAINQIKHEQIFQEVTNCRVKKRKQANNPIIKDIQIEDSIKFLHTILLVLFPQRHFTKKDEKDDYSDYDEVIKSDLSLLEQQVFDSFVKDAKNVIDFGDDQCIVLSDKYEQYKKYCYYILACYLLLTLQNDSACSNNENLGDYPYLEFYKYLIKRNETDLLKYVDWSPAGARTKNKINRMKIDIQLDYPDAYAILNKNESHIRMASSSWHVSSFIINISLICTIAIIIILGMLYLNRILPLDLNEEGIKNVLNFTFNHFNIFLVFLPPLLLHKLMILMKNRIEHFIHYQRLREIYFTIFIYNKLARIKKRLNKKTNSKEGYYYYY